MSRKQVQSSAAGLITLVIFAVVLLGFRPGPDSTDAGDAPKGGLPITMPANLGGLQISLGLKDTAGTVWDGDITVSKGKILSVDIVQGHPKASVSGNKFVLRSVLAKKKKEKKKDEVTRPILRVNLDAPAGARVQVNTKQGNFAFTLDELPLNAPKTFLDGAASVQREDGAVQIAATPNEEDYPVIAKAPDGKIWLAYCEYKKGQPYVTERVLTGNFDELVPKGNGDQIKLKSFDGTVWSAPIDVTDAGLDIWRPTLTVGKDGRVHVAWTQQIDGKWNVHHRWYDPASAKWSAPRTVGKGRSMNVVAATDAKGIVRFAYQRYDTGKLAIATAHWQDSKGAKSEGEVVAISKPTPNCWSPAIATDSKGNTFVAYDAYDNGSYDIHLRVNDGETKIPVANSPRFEARPSIVVDKQDRVWIAYEEGDEQWGKDYSNNMFRKIGLNENPGFGLYINRTIRVKCVVNGKVMEPAGDLQKAIAKRTGHNRSVPRLAADADGSIWLFYRHHPKPLQTGEVWNSYATRYDGKTWSAPRMLSLSENLMDNSPAVIGHGKGVLAVYSGDGRPNQLNRKQNDLFAAVLRSSEPVQEMSLATVVIPPASDNAPKKAVHPNELKDVARMRDYRFEHEGKKLRLFRGEFHRHTEYTAHRDGDGLLEDSWRYALDAGMLDWMGNADHDNGHHDEYSWWQIQKFADLMHNPPHFVAVQSYERSVKYPDGHRNVIMPKRGIRPLPRGDLKSGTEEKGTPDTKILYKYLKHFGSMCSSHTSGTGMGTDWRDNDPVVEPVVEVYQGHRHNYEHFGAPRSATENTQIGGYEPKGFIWNAFAKGYKLGFQSSSDHVSTHMSYGVVLTDDLSRQGIIDAFKRRHSYAATDNIIVEFRCGKQIMGDIFETKDRPKFDIKILGTAPITKVSIVRDAKYIHVETPKKDEATLSFTDKDAPAGKTSYYYVRVEQADGNLAWASPMWITYRP